MRVLSRSLSVIALAGVLAAVAWAVAPGPRPKGRTASPEELIGRMSLQEKAGQMVMAGFPGTSAGTEAETLIRRYHVGGVILFAQRNMTSPAQVAALTAELQRLATRSGAGIPLWIATDEEGGLVTRLPGVAPFPGNMALGAAGSPDLAQRVGAAIGQQLRAVGINMDFAPVVDVNANPRNPVIGVRSFGEDPDLVANLGAAVVRGLQGEGVAATAKHFPGHGDTAVDSHIDLPSVDHSAEVLERLDLRPFRAAIAAGVDAIMTAHLTVPAIDPTPGLPATLSPRVLTDLLRRRLGFQGLIITDAMEMGAIANNFGFEDAVVRAVEAGADIVLVAWPKDWRDAMRAVDAIVAAVQAGRLTEARLDESVRRIIQMKQARGLFSPITSQPNQVGRPEHRELALEVARASVTLVRDGAGLIPLPPAKAGRVLVVAPKPAAVTPAEQRQRESLTLEQALAVHYPQVSGVTIDLRPDEAQREAVLARARQADTIVVGTLRASSSAYQAQAALVRALAGLDKRLIVVSLREPYDLQAFPQVKTYLAAYGGSPASLTAVAEILAGVTPPRGRLPVAIPGLHARGTGIVR